MIEMNKKIGEMTVAGLSIASKIFLERNNISEQKLARFSLDIYFPEDKVAFEYDGPDHYDKVANHERDLRKNALCQEQGIRLVRWPYYFQLTKDVARYVFLNNYSDEKYKVAIDAVYGTRNENEILAPGLHKSKFTPANFTSPGMKRFLKEMNDAPVSLLSQVIYSFKLYEAKIIRDHGEDFLWLLYPESNPAFEEFMEFVPNREHLHYHYINA
jgi:hypothetical protein